MALVSVGYIFGVFIEGAVAFINKGGLAVGGKLFKIARAKIANNIKGVSRCNSRQ